MGDIQGPRPHPSNVSCFVRATTPVSSPQACKGIICRAQPLGIGLDGGNGEGPATTHTQERSRPSPCLQHPGSNPVRQLCSAAEPSLTRGTQLGASQVLKWGVFCQPWSPICPPPSPRHGSPAGRADGPQSTVCVRHGGFPCYAPTGRVHPQSHCC